MSKLIQWVKGMCRSWYVWDEVVVVLQRMSDLLAAVFRVGSRCSTRLLTPEME